MKQYLRILFLATLLQISFLSDIPALACEFKGIPLHGRVKIVKYFADINVQVVSSFADLRVQSVKHHPTECGQWQFVDNFPDFTIKFVDHFPDLKIQFVKSFPGKP